MDKKKILLPMLALLFVVVSCKKNLVEYNNDPGKATAEEIQFDNIAAGSKITQMQTSFFATASNTGSLPFQVGLNLAGDIFSGQQAPSNVFNNGGSNNSTYNMTPAWYNVFFAFAFQNNMAPWYGIKDVSPATSPAYALAQILKVYGMSRVTDMYGPLPYLTFVPGNLSYTYDSQKDIYTSFFSDLNGAIAILTDYVDRNPGAAPAFTKTDNSSWDLIYGDKTDEYRYWIKFANSLKLRLAMRVVYTNTTFNSFSAQQLAEQAVASKYGVMTATDDNALIRPNGVTNSNFLFTTCYSYNDTRMSANMESFLKGYNDPRAQSLFTQVAIGNTGADYHGVRSGIANPVGYRGFSQMRVALTTPIQVLTAAETYFLRAEGALRGWNMAGSAQSLYESGIQMAFVQSGASGDVTSYIQGTTRPAAYVDPINSANSIALGNANLSTVTVRWNNGASDFETNLERIITQKWLALYPDGQEAWSEYRRTGYPKVFPVMINNSAGLVSTQTQVRRIPFPSTEYQVNANNVRQAVTLLTAESSGAAQSPGDNAGTKLWWDKNPRH